MKLVIYQAEVLSRLSLQSYFRRIRAVLVQ